MRGLSELPRWRLEVRLRDQEGIRSLRRYSIVPQPLRISRELFISSPSFAHF